MARIRSMKPELRTSLVVAEWPRDVRYLFTLLWGYLDDHGYGVDDARLVKADCLPLDEDVTPKIVDEWLAMMATSGPICRYVVNSKRFIHAPNWDEHQKPAHPKPTKIPPCPYHDLDQPRSDLHEDLTKSSGSAPEIFAPEQGAGSREMEQGDGAGKRATRVNARSAPLPDSSADFERFWNAYPRKEAKGAARKAWLTAAKKTAPESIIAGAERYRDQPGRDPKFTAHPATWLNGERWGDDPPPTRRDGLSENRPPNYFRSPRTTNPFEDDED